MDIREIIDLVKQAYKDYICSTEQDPEDGNLSAFGFKMYLIQELETKAKDHD